MLLDENLCVYDCSEYTSGKKKGCNACRRNKERKEVRERRGCGLGLGWHGAETTCFGCASSREKRHRHSKARLFLLLTRRRDVSLSLRRIQADGQECCRESVELFAGGVVGSKKVFRMSSWLTRLRDSFSASRFWARFSRALRTETKAPLAMFSSFKAFFNYSRQSYGCSKPSRDQLLLFGELQSVSSEWVVVKGPPDEEGY